MTVEYAYAVLEQSEKAGLSSLDDMVYLNRDEATERAAWLADHLTGSYRDAGDTTCSVVGFELTAKQHAVILMQYDESFVG